MRSKPVLVAVAIAVLLVLATAGTWWAFQGSGGAGDPQSAAKTSFPDLQPATGPPGLPSLETLSPRAGQVVQAAGPFDDRFRLRQLTFDGTTVRGSAEITSDVSELLEFEALAGFYDRSGKLVGTGRHVYHLDADHGHDAEGELAHEFSIAVPQNLRGAAVSAAVGVPVLVNE